MPSRCLTRHCPIVARLGRHHGDLDPGSVMIVYDSSSIHDDKPKLAYLCLRSDTDGLPTAAVDLTTMMILPTTTTISPSMFITLPSELIEAVLVSAASPRTVAAVSQTCRALYALVYASPDSHLWRELFLGMWDDPRPALECRGRVDPRVLRAGLEWDWGVEYRRRIDSELWLRAWRRDVCAAESNGDDDEDDDDREEEHQSQNYGGDVNLNPHSTPHVDLDDVAWYETTLTALRALLSSLLTLLPFPASPPIALTVISPVISPYPVGNQGSGVGDRKERMSNAPPFPPLLIVLASQFGGFESSRSGARVGRVVFGPHATVLRNSVGPSETHATPTSTQTPTPSLPPQLVRTLLASCAVDVRGLPAYGPSMSGVQYWGSDPLGDVFHRIICVTGFVPIPPPLDLSSSSALTSTTTYVHESTSTSGSSSTSESIVAASTEEEASSSAAPSQQPARHIPKAFPTPLEQYADARTLARRRVYEMRYLRGDRLWGPYHSVTKEVLEGRPPTSGRDKKPIFYQGNKSRRDEGGRTRSSQSAATLEWFNVEFDNADSTSEDTEDEDWQEPAAEVGSRSSSESRENESEEVAGDQDEADVDEEEMNDVDPGLPVILIETVDPPPTTNTASAGSRSSRRRTRRSNPRRPPSISPRSIKSYHLRPDYTYLASVRIVVEANLRELFESVIGDDVESAPEIGPGDTGMFWEDEEFVRPLGGTVNSASYPRASSLARTVPMGDPDSNSTLATLELADILSLFRNLEVARLGSGCGFWGGWINRQRSATSRMGGNVNTSALLSLEESIGLRKPKIVEERADLEQPRETSASGEKGKGKAKASNSVDGIIGELGDWEIGPEGEACEGWDWAGVAGIWRRCVCWMDYRELLFFNLDSTKFLTRSTQEACRIIPMDLQITGYSRAGVMPVYNTEPECEILYSTPSDGHSGENALRGYFRPPPVIHFSGSAVGSDRGLEDGRTVTGSVQLIGGGEVRWQMDSNLPETSAPEWSSEAVQVGGIGSTVGILGMWTGAGHERADPLGPFWAWRVA
ncbi:hypothetical protein JVU11DRAFT_7109 [Chiua virens]|nr:hypothetical protein JVU11DRAFT_7109 [Chiua virens]